MRLLTPLTTLISSLALVGCMHKGPNPDDPYEAINRKTHAFNTTFDAIFLKPPARVYKAVVPAPIRAGVNNFYNNVNMIPTVANDLLQGEWHHAANDSGRFLLNSTLGLAGLIDVASNVNIPLHSNDLGLTFAKWGDKKSPYIVIPFLGPSTIRDGMGMLFEYTLLTPYPYLHNDTAIYSLLVLRYVDLRSQFLETEHLMDEALDKYSFMRDAYLQHRHFQITGEQATTNSDADTSYVDDDENGNADPNYVDDADASGDANATVNSSDYVDEIPTNTDTTSSTTKTLDTNDHADAAVTKDNVTDTTATTVNDPTPALNNDHPANDLSTQKEG